jgi:oligopeptide transport system permease protein
MAPAAPDHSRDLERYARLLAEAQGIHGTSLAADAWRRLKNNRVAMASLWFLAILAVLALLTPVLPLQSPMATDTKQAFAGPTLWPLMIDSLRIPDNSDAAAGTEIEGKADWIDKQFGELDRVNRWFVEIRAKVFGRWSLNSFCGRDDLGRDLLARLFWGARISLIVGLVAAMVSLVIGVTYGAISGYCGGRTDNFMMRLVEVLYSVPFVFVVIYIITILSEESIKAFLDSYGIDRIKILFVVVGAIYWLTMARVVRGQVLSLKNEQFVEAARTIGARPSRVLFVHIVPNLLSVIIVYLTLTIPRVMLYEAFLSFLGLGVQAPNVSWGLLANEGFRMITPVKIFWWLFVFPSLAMGMTLFALNFLGDGLRDALDPRLKHK